MGPASVDEPGHGGADATRLPEPRFLDAALASRGASEDARRRRLEQAGASPQAAREALAHDDLRVRAREKTPLADLLLFTREGLEQATAEAVAVERAARFSPFPTVADLGAGLGLDTIALARAGRRVVAVERDPRRAALLRHNVRAAGVGDRVTVVEGDALLDPPAADAAFLDPDRRPAGRRTHDLDLADPPRAAWDALASRYRGLLVKLAPATRREALPEGLHPGVSMEWVSLDGEMREARAAFGALAHAAPRRALALPGGAALEGAGIPWPPPRAPAPGDVVLLPDPAVVLAGLVGDLAAAHGASPVHPRIAALVAAGPMPPGLAPLARPLRVDEVLRAEPRVLRAALARAGAGDVVVHTRGVADPAATWRGRIGAWDARPGGPRVALLLTRGPDDRYVALRCGPA